MEEKTIMKSKRSSVYQYIFLAAVIVGFFLTLYFGVIPLVDRIHYSYQDPLAIIGLVLFIPSVILLIYISDCELTVTDKRVYGKAAFGKRVDLPLDSISAVSVSGLFNGIAVATSSGRVSFLAITNSNELHKAISNLLLERQSKPKESPVIKQEISQSTADEIKKYKELVDSGIITQEEFDAKKKQLLGL